VGRCRSKGFTLVEILVTLAMMGTIMTALYGSYEAVARVREAFGPNFRQTQRVVWMLHRLRRSLRGVYSRPRDTKADSIARKTIEEILPPGDFIADSRSSQTDLNYVCVVVSRDTERCTLQRVYVRWTRSDNCVYMATTSAVSLPEEDAEDVLDWECLLDTVEVFEVSFLEGGQWSDVWPNEKGSMLPEAVRIAVTLQAENKRPKSWNMTVLPALKPSMDRIEESL
jgi:type II secretion system protein J